MILDKITSLANKVKSQNSISTIPQLIELCADEIVIIMNYFRSSNFEPQSEGETFILSLCSFLQIENKFIDEKDLCKFLAIKRIEFLPYLKVLKSLIEKGYIKSEFNDFSIINQYYVSRKIQRAIEEDHEVLTVNYIKSIKGLLDISINSAELCESEIASLEDGYERIRKYYDSTIKNEFIDKLFNSELNDFDILFSLIVLNLYEVSKQAVYLDVAIQNLFKGDPIQGEIILKSFVEGENILLKKGILEFKIEDGDNYIILSDNSISEYKSKEKVKENIKVEKKNSDLKYYKLEELPKLFYNPEIETQIRKLEELLKPEKFNAYMDSLEQKNLNTSFNILLTGSAGSGKTSLTKYLAAKCNLGVYEVNISEFRDSYYGESEKKVVAIFRKYQKMLDEAFRSGSPTILLSLQECDGIFQERSFGNDSSTSSTEHRIQNILLTEIENLKRGVIVATSNFEGLNQNSALARRFIYKLRCENPTEEVRYKIVKSYFPELSEKCIQNISKYEINGATAMNLQKKLELEKIIGGDVNEEIILSWVKEEVAFKKNGLGMGGIGFRKAS